MKRSHIITFHWVLLGMMILGYARLVQHFSMEIGYGEKTTEKVD